MGFSQLCALTIATVACACDLHSRRIPNVLTFGAAAAGVVFHALTAGPVAAGHSLLGWLIGALVFVVPFALRGLGGGDVKLLAALGAWLGPTQAIWLALYTGVAGGVLALIVALAHGYARTAIGNVRRLLIHWSVAGVSAVDDLTLDASTAPKLAYAVPILVGLVTTLLVQ